MRSLPFSVFLCVAVLLAFAETAERRKLIRKTKYGRVRGTYTDLAQVFYGIPFAAPAQRWTAPVEPDPWRGTLDAREVKPMCFQASNCTQDYPYNCVPEKSEDCLYLDIFAPLATKQSSRKAVLVFIHGGRYEGGTGAARLYNAEEFVRKGDIIVVNINYRLGAFGFLATGSSPNDITGNYGLLDQKLAMQWVKRNIKKFGGDKNKITIAGHCGGAYSVGIHLTSGRVDNLFSQAIIQSSLYTIPLKTMEAAKGQAERFADQADCLDDQSINITCLHALSPEHIVSIQGTLESTTFPDSQLRAFMAWLPHIDDKEVKTGLIEALNDTMFPPKPLMLGTVKNEGQLFIRSIYQDPLGVVGANFLINLFIKNAPSDILELYPYTNFTDYREELGEIITDYLFYCPNRLVARAQSDRMPVYTYDFQQPVNFPNGYLYSNAPFCVGRNCHWAELPFVFQSAREEPVLFNSDEFALSDDLITYWSSFVKYGNPNRDVVDGTRWVRYSDAKESTLIMEGGWNGIRNVRGLKALLCDVWDTTGYQ